jgi:hypothetical protein
MSGDKIEKSKQSTTTAVFTFGRFQPPHIGHALLINSIIDSAHQNNADSYVVVSASCNEKWFESKIYKTQKENNEFIACPRNENPLDVNRRIHYLKKMFPNLKFIDAQAEEYGNKLFDIIRYIHDQGYTNIIGIFGSDRAKKLETQFNATEEKYRKEKEKDPNFKFTPIHVDVISAGERDDKAKGIEGASATKMREAAVSNKSKDIDYFTQHSQIGNMTLEDTYAMREEVRVALWNNEPLEATSKPKPRKPRQTTTSTVPVPSELPPVRRSTRLTTGGKNPKVCHTERPKKYKLKSDEKPYCP